MKKLLIITLFVAAATSVNAQPKIGGSLRLGVPRAYVAPRVFVNPYYNNYAGYYRPGYRYGFHHPYYRERYVQSKPTELDLTLEQIKNDYDYEIDKVKHDKTLPKDVRKQQEKDLKHQRDEEIINAKKKYYNYSDTNSNSNS